jgi:uncharacterized protein YhaN
VARIEGQQRTTLLEIEEKAVRYLKDCAGAAAAEQALRAYRDRHRSSMMARASEAFRTISRGAYTGLGTQLDRDTQLDFADLCPVLQTQAQKFAASETMRTACSTGGCHRYRSKGILERAELINVPARPG